MLDGCFFTFWTTRYPGSNTDMDQAANRHAAEANRNYAGTHGAGKSAVHYLFFYQTDGHSTNKI